MSLSRQDVAMMELGLVVCETVADLEDVSGFAISSHVVLALQQAGLSADEAMSVLAVLVVCGALQRGPLPFTFVRGSGFASFTDATRRLLAILKSGQPPPPGASA